MELEAKVAEVRARVAAKASEAATKAEHEDRLRKKLGVVVGEEESLGDTVCRGAEQALKDEARCFLEGVLGGK